MMYVFRLLDFYFKCLFYLIISDDILVVLLRWYFPFNF